MSILKETKRIFRNLKMSPKKRLGQYFLVDEYFMHLMIDAASISNKEIVLEIGAGLGFLTKMLAKKAKKVIAVEISQELSHVLHKRIVEYSNVIVIEGDILKIKIPLFDKVVSTPPYSISSHLLFWLLSRGFKKAVLAFQKEFAQRLVAPVATSNYGRLTVTSQYRSKINILETIPKSCFWPIPKVDSAIITLEPRKIPFSVLDESIFLQVTRTIFSQKNKKLKNAIIPFICKYLTSKKEAHELASNLSYQQKRPRELSLKEIAKISDEIVMLIQSKK